MGPQIVDPRPVLAPDLQQVLAKADNGEYRIYSPAGGPTYVILVREILTGRTASAQESEALIRSKLIGLKRQRVFDDYIARLRSASEVRILVTPQELETLVGTSPG